MLLNIFIDFSVPELFLSHSVISFFLYHLDRYTTMPADNFVRRHRELFGNDPMAIAGMLQFKGLMHAARTCPNCQLVMVLRNFRTRYFDKIGWHCNHCRSSLSIRNCTFFEEWTRTPFAELLHAISKWSSGTTAKNIAEETGLGYKMVLKLCKKLRQRCSNKMLRDPVEVGGNPLFVVQIDESQFHHKQRQHVGRIAQQPIWVFGAVDTSFTPAKGYVEIVARRDRVTLTTVLNRVLNAGSVVHSDQWRAYNNLPQFVPTCILHNTVNYTYNFVDPGTGAHTQHIESHWNRIKGWLKPKKGIIRDELHGYLQEFMWRDWYGGNNAFDSIIGLINDDYPL